MCGRQSELSIAVPTMGRSVHLERCLKALGSQLADHPGGGELVLVVPRAVAGAPWLEAARRWVDRVVEAERSGFSAANNRAFTHSRAPFWGTVNDDAVVEGGWVASLMGLLGAFPEAGSAQGLVLRMEDPNRVDGAGIGWNRFWQAQQIGHGRSVADIPTGSGPRPIFGVSATAAIYRRQALDQVTLPAGPFDEELWAYYEDVDLAWRLRAAGFGAWIDPQARARHAGSITGKTLPHAGRPLIHGNRHLVLARHLGRSYGPRLPWLLGRDLLDLSRCLLDGDLAAARGIAVGLARAGRRLPRFAHLGAARPSPRDLASFSDDFRAKIRPVELPAGSTSRVQGQEEPPPPPSTPSSPQEAPIRE